MFEGEQVEADMNCNPMFKVQAFVGATGAAGAAGFVGCCPRFLGSVTVPEDVLFEVGIAIVSEEAHMIDCQLVLDPTD